MCRLLLAYYFRGRNGASGNYWPFRIVEHLRLQDKIVLEDGISPDYTNNLGLLICLCVSYKP